MRQYESRGHDDVSSKARISVFKIKHEETDVDDKHKSKKSVSDDAYGHGKRSPTPVLSDCIRHDASEHVIKDNKSVCNPARRSERLKIPEKKYCIECDRKNRIGDKSEHVAVHQPNSP